MSDYSRLGLLEHNIDGYEKVKEHYKKDNVTCVVRATGTGKSYIGLQLALDNNTKKALYVVPNESIAEHLEEVISENNKVSREQDFPNLKFITYQKLINMSIEEIGKLDAELLILDEFHHIGAPVWGKKIEELIETHKNMQIFGMTAYTVRDRGTSNERDMIDPESDELFSGKEVAYYDLCDAMIDGVLPKPNYKSGYLHLEKTYNDLEKKINLLDYNSNEYKQLLPLINDIKKRIHEVEGISDIFKKNIKPNGKYIYFCPPNSEDGVNDIESIKYEVKKWVNEMGLTEDDYVFYVTTKEMRNDGKKNRAAFYNDKDLEEKNSSNKLRIMFAINQYSEGVHAPGLDGVIMGRSTKSDIIFFEQLGRTLSVGSKTKKEYEKYMSKSMEELIEECKRKELRYKDMSKEELIESLVAPVILDLSNNIGFIKELESKLKIKYEKYQSHNKNVQKKSHIENYSFNIDMINEDLFKIVEYLRDRLTMSWLDKFQLAKVYFEHNGNLEIPFAFKTLNGTDYDENGFALGRWISNQRHAYNGNCAYIISNEHVEMLKSIGMRFEIKKKNDWDSMYKLAKAYFNHYHNLEIPVKFKTKDGINYDENGVTLRDWVHKQKAMFNEKGDNRLTEEKIQLLRDIKMDFNIKDKNIEWNKKYELAKAYFNHYHNLEMPAKFKTKDGINYDEDGVALGEWIHKQRATFNGKGDHRLTEERIQLLRDIKMNFNIKDKNVEWNNKYELAKVYFEHNGNLQIGVKFKTKNGYEFDTDGIALGRWIETQKKAFYGKEKYKITRDQIEALTRIGMVWQSDTINEKSQKEIISDENIDRKTKEIYNRTIEYLTKYETEELLSKEKVNQEFLNELNSTGKKK